MRSRASTAQSAIAISATRTVIGLLRAARTRRMLVKSSSKTPACRPARPSFARMHKAEPHATGRSSASLSDEGLNIAAGRGHAEQAAPDGEAGQRVVDLGLGEQPLRVGDLRNGAETR